MARFLVVHHDADTRELLRTSLLRARHAVACTGSSLAAMESLCSEEALPPDVVLVAHDMPGGGAELLARQIRGRRRPCRLFRVGQGPAALYHLALGQAGGGDVAPRWAA